MARPRLASEIVGFAMILALISGVGASLIYFMGAEIDSSRSTSESVVRQKISKISESLRIIRTYSPAGGGADTWGIEVVNTGSSDIRIAGIHYLLGGRVISKDGCDTMEIVGPAGARPCVIGPGVITDMRFTPGAPAGADGSVDIVVETASGNAFALAAGT